VHEKTILEKLLPFHPESEKKIGCGVDYITVYLSLPLLLCALLLLTKGFPNITFFFVESNNCIFLIIFRFSKLLDTSPRLQLLPTAKILSVINYKIKVSDGW